MRADRRFRALLPALACVVSACATPDLVILLPQPDGKPSALVIQPKGGAEAVLSTPYAQAQVSDGRVALGTADAGEVARRYQGLSDAMPPRPRSYVLYFLSGSNQLAPESDARLAEILGDIARLPAPELVVIGHTDSVGTDSANDAISRQRADLIRARLIEKGIGAERIEAVGRGKRELLVPTADGVDEPRNRRVEIRLK